MKDDGQFKNHVNLILVLQLGIKRVETQFPVRSEVGNFGLRCKAISSEGGYTMEKRRDNNK